MEDRNSGWIYIVNGGNGLYKIGKAIDWEKRLKDLQIGSPVPLEIFHYFRCDDLKRIERFIHLVLDDVRHHGEWFALPPYVLETISGVKDFDLDDLEYKRVRRRILPDFCIFESDAESISRALVSRFNSTKGRR